MEQLPRPSIEKIPKVTELLEGEPEAVFILTGAMKYSEQKGRYESGSFSDKDENSGLATGGKDRMLAAVELHHLYPKSTVVPMSRTRNSDLPTYAEVMQGELEWKGVPAEAILQESDSVDTITEFKQAARFIEEHGWQNVVFVSSDYHIPRVKALLNCIENFADTSDETELLKRFADGVRSGDLVVQYIGSGQVLGPVSSHYRNLFQKVSLDEGIQRRVALEEQALKQITEGTYGSYLLTKHIFPESS